ncbi:MAG: glycine dehydrogenase, partial [Deltaproteobacteria bacterium]|nr:glycine dehydrogenase [Deltaproteobacteria bacterium]
RRERATSNICTNHNLMALAFCMTLALYGKSGFRKLALNNIQKTLYFRKQAHEAGLQVLSSGTHFNETLIKLTESQARKARALEKQDVFAGVWLDRNQLLVTTTELHDESEVRDLARSLV